MKRFFPRHCTVVLLLLGLAGCAGADAPPPMPPSQAESMPLPPIAAGEQVWRPGHWNWDGSGYRWMPGEYQPRTASTTMWRSGVWRRDASGWVWQPAGWM